MLSVTGALADNASLMSSSERTSLGCFSPEVLSHAPRSPSAAVRMFGLMTGGEAHPKVVSSGIRAEVARNRRFTRPKPGRSAPSAHRDLARLVLSRVCV